MILRRVIEHVKAQNWTAIALDFVIVVTGVFVGLQVSNWNEARKDDAWELAFLSDMLVEMQENRAQLVTILAFQTQKNAALKELSVMLDGEITVESLAEMEQKFFFAQSSNKTFFPTKGVYLSALSSGRIDQIDDKALKYAVMNLYEHFYTRLVYNGGLYDQRVDQANWDMRVIADIGKQRFSDANFTSSADFHADIDILAVQSRIYAALAKDNLTQIDKVMTAIRTELGNDESGGGK